MWLRVAGGGRFRLPHVAAACLGAVALYAGGMAAASLAAERQMAALLARQAGAAPVEVLAIPEPGNPFRRGIVAVYPDVYRFYELDWLASPPLRTTADPVPRGPEGPISDMRYTRRPGSPGHRRIDRPTAVGTTDRPRPGDRQTHPVP